MTTAIFGSLTIKTATNPIHNINFPKINIEKPKEIAKEIDENAPDIVDWDWLDDEEEYIVN